MIAGTALELLAANPPGRPVRLLGVRLASFEDGGGPQPPAGAEALRLPVVD